MPLLNARPRMDVIPSKTEGRAEEVVGNGSVSASSVSPTDRAPHATRATSGPWDGSQETSRSLGSNFLRSISDLARNDTKGIDRTPNEEAA